jgi:hypothetical protein
MFSPDVWSRTSFRNVSLFLLATSFVCHCVFVFNYIGILAPLASFCLWVAVSLIATWVFPWLLEYQGVCGCACALVCIRYLCFPGFQSCEVCSGWATYCHRCLTCFKGLCCVCTQVSGSVVSNWPLCEFWTCIVVFLVYIFYSSIFWDTRRWIKSKSTIRSRTGMK